MAGLTGLGLLVAACGSDDASANPTTTTLTTTTAAEPTTTTASSESTTTTTATTVPPSSASTTTTTTTVPTTTESPTTVDEGQDRPVINDWLVETESVPCEESDLPGSPGGEAVVPANWAAGNADYVDFLVDGDLRPANSVRDVTGPGNVQVPCDPALNDGHELTVIAYTGTPGDPGPETASQTLVVITTATKER